MCGAKSAKSSGCRCQHQAALLSREIGLSLRLGFCFSTPRQAPSIALIIPTNLCLSELRRFRPRLRITRDWFDCDLRCS